MARVTYREAKRIHLQNLDVVGWQVSMDPAWAIDPHTGVKVYFPDASHINIEVAASYPYRTGSATRVRVPLDIRKLNTHQLIAEIRIAHDRERWGGW